MQRYFDVISLVSTSSFFLSMSCPSNTWTVIAKEEPSYDEAKKD